MDIARAMDATADGQQVVVEGLGSDRAAVDAERAVLMRGVHGEGGVHFARDLRVGARPKQTQTRRRTGAKKLRRSSYRVPQPRFSLESGTRGRDGQCEAKARISRQRTST